MNISKHNGTNSTSDDRNPLISNNCLANSACEICTSRHLSLCSVLNRSELDALSLISSDYQKKAKQTICSEEDNADYLFNIRSGAVRISKMLSDGRRQITGFLFAGDFFGLSCDKKYSYTAEAITDVEICRFPRQKMIETFREIPKLNERVFEMTRTELQSSHEQMLLLGRKTAKEKLCSFLLNMAKKSRVLGQLQENEIDLPMSRSDIADYLGLTVETVSRQFTNLNKLGLIELDGAHKVFLNEADTLAALAVGD